MAKDLAEWEAVDPWESDWQSATPPASVVPLSAAPQATVPAALAKGVDQLDATQFPDVDGISDWWKSGGAGELPTQFPKSDLSDLRDVNPNAPASEGFMQAAKETLPLAKEAAMAPFAAGGRFLHLGMEDIGQWLAANWSGEMPTESNLLKYFGPEGEQLPYQKTQAAVAKSNPISTTAAKIAGGLAETAPLIAAGLPGGITGRAASGVFAYDMAKSGGQAAGRFMAEMDKPEAKRDWDVITTSLADLGMSSLSPMAAYHALAGRGVTGKVENASNIESPAEVHGNVRPQPGEGAREMPAEESGGGIQPPGEGSARPAEVPPKTSPLSEAEAEDLHQLQQAGQQGRLTMEEAQRLHKLEQLHNSGMSADERTYIEDIADELNHKVDFVEGDPEGPYSGVVMRPNPDTGKIEIDPAELARTTSDLSPQERRNYIKSAMDEEGIHFATADSEAERWALESTGAERFLAAWRYTGNISGKTDAGQAIRGRLLGFEMNRLQAQRARGIEPTETAQLARTNLRQTLRTIREMSPQQILKFAQSNLLTTKLVIGTENAIFDIRKALGTDASKNQIKMLDDILSNLNIGRKALGMGSQPSTIRRTDEEAGKPDITAMAGRKAGTTGVEELASLSSEDANKYFSEIRKNGNATQNDGVIAGMKLTPEDVPRLKQMADEAGKAALAGIKAGNSDAYQGEFGKVVWLNGAIEGANKAGPNYKAVTERMAKNGEQPASINRRSEEGRSALASLEKLTNDQIEKYPFDSFATLSRSLKYIINSEEHRSKESAEYDLNEWYSKAKAAISLISEKTLRELPQDFSEVEAPSPGGRVIQSSPLNPDASNNSLSKIAISLRSMVEDAFSHFKELPKSDEQSFPAAIRRGGMTKKAQEIAEQKRRIAEMFAKSRGEELPQGLQTKPAQPQFAPIPPEERVGSGVNPPSAAEIEAKAKEVLSGKIKASYKPRTEAAVGKEEKSQERPGKMGVQAGKTKWKYPSFQYFKKSIGWEGSLESSKLRELWEDTVWKELQNASPERLAEWRKGLGMKSRYGTRNIPEAPSVEAQKAQAQDVKQKVAAVRLGKTIERMEKQASDLEQKAKKVSNTGETEQGGIFAGQVTASGDMMARAAKIRSRAGQLLYLIKSGASLTGESSGMTVGKQMGLAGVEQPQESSKVPVPGVQTGLAAWRYRNSLISAIARRLIGEAQPRSHVYDRDSVSIDDVDFSNTKTELGPYVEISKDDLTHKDVLSTILRDQARGSSVDPESASKRLVAVVDREGKVSLLSTYNDHGIQRVTDPSGSSGHKPYRELNSSFLAKYRPFASILLTDPVKGFRQSFETVSEFMDKIGKEASGRARLADWEAVPEGPAPEDFEAEGTPGIEGEGGSFMGPGKRVAQVSSSPGSMESAAPLTSAEAKGLMSHIYNSSDFESAADVETSLGEINTRAASKELTPSDRVALSAYRKIFNILDRKYPDMPKDNLIELMSQRIYDAGRRADSQDEFVRNLNFNLGISPEGIPGEAAHPGGREIVHMRDIAPTTVRGEQGPKLPAPPAELGATEQRTAEPIPGEQTMDAEHLAQKLSWARKWNMSSLRTKGREVPTAALSQQTGLPEDVIRENADFISGKNPERPPTFKALGEQPAAIRRKVNMTRAGKKLTDILKDVGSSYDEWLTDRMERKGGETAKNVAPVFRSVIDRSKQLYGDLTPSLDKARALAGGTRQVKVAGQLPSIKAMRAGTWLHGIDKVPGAAYAGTRRAVNAIEGKITVPEYAKPTVEAAQEANLEIGKMVEPVAAGFQSSGDYIGSLTDIAKDMLTKRVGPVFKKWVESVALDNDKSQRSVRKEMLKLKAIITDPKVSDMTKEAANQDFLEKFPNVTMDIEHDGKKIKLIQNYKASGAFARNVSAIGYDAIRQGDGSLWRKWTAGSAKLNGIKVQEARKFFREWKAVLDKPGVGIDAINRVNQDFARVMPKVVTDVYDNGMWHSVVHGDLFNYLENAAQRAAHVRAFREIFPNNKAGRQRLAELGDRIRAESGPESAKAYDTLVRTMQGIPADNYSSWGFLSPTEPAGQAFKALNQTVGNMMAKLVLTGQMFVQPGETIAGSAPVFLGWRNYLRGMSQLRQTYSEMEKQGMVNRVMYDFTFDPNSPIRSAFRIANNTISKVFMEQALNELQEGLAAATSKVVSERIKSGVMSPWEERMLPETFKAMGFKPDEISAMMLGDSQLLDEFQRKAAAFLTAGNKSGSESSMLGSKRLFNSAIRFQSYPMMKGNQFRKVATSLSEAWTEGSKEQKRTATEQFARFLFGNAAQGALTTAITALAYGGIQGLRIRKNEAQDEPAQFIGESFMASVGGPLYLLWRGMKNKGWTKMGEGAARMIWPYTVAQELIDFSGGIGKYKDADTFDKIGKFLDSKVPGSRAISTGLSMFGLSQEDRALDASISGFYRWRRDTFVDTGTGDDVGPEERKAFRVKMKKAIEALKDGDKDKFVDYYTDAAGELAEIGAKGNPAESLRRAKVLKVNNKPLDPDQLEALRARIGDEAVDRLQWYDLMLDKAADGDLIPRYDE